MNFPRIVFNTRHNPGHSGHRIYFVLMRKALESLGITCSYQDWTNYDRYDVAIFNTSDNEVCRAKEQNPHLIVGLSKLVDTSLKSRQELGRADFLISDSVIQHDYYALYNSKILKLWLADVVPVDTEPKGLSSFSLNRPACIGYHGNKMHIQQWASSMWEALKKLAGQIPIRFLAVYNVRGLGECKLPESSFPVEHRQWDENTWLDALKECDVGIVPNLVPARNRLFHYTLQRLGQVFSVAPFPNDVTIRFKNSANVGRAFPWMHLGVPCVACPVPEAASVFGDQERGLTAYGPTAWNLALWRLLTEGKLYSTISAAAYHWAHEHITPQNNALKLLTFLQNEYLQQFSILDREFSNA